MGKKRKRKQKSDLSLPQSLSNATGSGLSADELKDVIVRAFMEIDSRRSEKAIPPAAASSDTQKITIKQVWRLLRTKPRDLRLVEGPVSAVKVITAFFCSLFAWSGYLIAGVLLISALFGICQVCTQPSISSIAAVIVLVFISLTILIVSKIISVTSVEIERSTENNVIFGVSGFFMSLATLILTAVTILYR